MALQYEHLSSASPAWADTSLEFFLKGVTTVLYPLSVVKTQQMAIADAPRGLRVRCQLPLLCIGTLALHMRHDGSSDGAELLRGSSVSSCRTRNRDSSTATSSRWHSCCQ